MVIHFLSSGIFAPDATTYGPIEMLLNAEDREERDRLTEKWRDNKLSELNFVGIVAALLTGCLTSTGSWPRILPNGAESPWPVRTSWYCGIILSLMSILTAAGQTIRLHRLSSHRDALPHIRHLLSGLKGRRKRSSRRIKPGRAQVYTWQLPVMFLAMGVLCMVIGMFMLVWSATWHLHKQNWWDENAKVAVTFTIVAFCSILVFFAGEVSLYSPSNGVDSLD
ncbi:hypothetical protein AOQ84DRAFT_319671 [Glonium stellatum]|uniref:Uncharacterized protein n=1 Tax=Glonium stellatum TaxID=574774 RepID=A0A8E2EZR2_9PEZI|nr:hypothetical protein AOQ84DRAFT_319671 [Glonium stellatum]